MGRPTMRRKAGLKPAKQVRFAAPSPLAMFPLSRDANLTDVWCGPRETRSAAWLDWEGDGDGATDLSASAGLDTPSALSRDFRRFESGGLFATLGQESPTPRRPRVSAAETRPPSPVPAGRTRRGARRARSR